MINLNITKKQLLAINGLFFCFGLLSINYKLGLIGLLILIINFYVQVYIIKKFISKKIIAIDYTTSFIGVISYYIVSLSILYYIFGLREIVVTVWFFVNFLLIIYIIISSKTEVYKINILKSLKKTSLKKENILFLLLSAGMLILLYSQPVLNGISSPWLSTSRIMFILFVIICMLFVSRMIKINLYFLYIFLFIIVGVISLKYILSFGYDTLLHQAALDYIVENGKIFPLTPFYIGQYSIEVLIHYFTGWSFVLIERFLLPVFFVVLITILGSLLSSSGNNRKNLAIILSVLFLIPSEFTVSSPFYFALLWSIVALVYIYLFLKNKDKKYFILSLLTSLVVLMTHPLIGINIFIGAIFAYLYNHFLNKFLKLSIILSQMVISPIITVVSFCFYSWWSDNELVLTSPFYYVYKFILLFSDPIYYKITSFSYVDMFVYYYEKMYLFLIIFIVILFVLVKRKIEFLYVFLLGISLALTSWLLISGVEISNYTFGDQYNYAYRLIHSMKWFFWPIVFLFTISLLRYIENLRKPVRIFFQIILIFILALHWYLCYPRIDSISQPNVNNIREIDYDAITLINERESGKEGYLVFANQLYGAAAIQQYGFNPYYQSQWGNLFYYSVPMGSKMNKVYENMMTYSDFELEEIYEIMRDIKIEKAYVIVTDYWPISSAIREKLVKNSIQRWNIGREIEIYLINITL